MSVIRERRRYFKREARFFLRYNYIKQVFMTGLVVLLTFGIGSVKTGIVSLLGIEYSLFSVPLGIFFDLLAFFITAPMYAGIVRVNVKLFSGENLPVSDVFYYFSSLQSLLDCYKFIIALCARAAVYAVPFLIIGALFPQADRLIASLLSEYAGPAAIDIIMLGVSLAYILAFIACLIIFMRYFAALFIFVKNPCLSVRDIMGKSARMMKKRKLEGLLLVASFAFWVLVSHFFAGFLYIFFTVPYLTLCYAAFMTYMLGEKGGDEFLNAATDYIDRIKQEQEKKLTRPEKKAQAAPAAAERTAQADLKKMLEEQTAQIDGIVEEGGLLNRLFGRKNS